MIYMSAAVAYLRTEFCGMTTMIKEVGGVAGLSEDDGWAEVWRDVVLAYRDVARDSGTAEGICAALHELSSSVWGTAGELLAGDLLKNEPLPDDLHDVAETWSGEGLAARVWIYWAEHDGCDGRDVCEALEAL